MSRVLHRNSPAVNHSVQLTIQMFTQFNKRAVTITLVLFYAEKVPTFSHFSSSNVLFYVHDIHSTAVITLQTRSTGTVHTSTKAHLTSVTIQICIWIGIRIATKI